MQRRVSASCAAGSSIRAIAADGTVTCQTDTGGATNAWTQGGNAFGAPGVIGTTDAQNLTVQSGGTEAAFVVAGNNGLRIGRATAIPSFNAPNIANGSADNVAGGLTVTSATVAGGGQGGTCIEVGIVGRPCANQATRTAATVSGGTSNAATGSGATVSGGTFNTASGALATVIGGVNNTASGAVSFAGGQGAKTESSAAVPTIFNGAFVWAETNPSGASQTFHAAASNEFAVRSRGGVRLVTGVDAAGLPTKTFSIAAASGDVNAPNIVTAQGKFSAPNNFPAGINNKNIGDRFRDNSIIAWGRILGGGSINENARFGITSVTRNAVGSYTVVIDVTATDTLSILPVVTPEVDVQPTSAATIRIASVNQFTLGVGIPNSFQVWINNGLGAPADNDFLMIVTGK